MAAQGFKNERYRRSEQKMQGSLSCILLVKQVAKTGWDSKGRGLDRTLSEFSLEEKQRIFDCLKCATDICIQPLFFKKEVK